MNTKQLHKHSVPIIVLGVGIMFLSVIAYQRFAQPAVSARGKSVADILNSTLLTIKPAKSTNSSLFRISLNKSTAEAAPVPAPTPSIVQPSDTVQAVSVAKQIQLHIAVDQAVTAAHRP